MFAGFGYAVAAFDGRGKDVCPERAIIDDLNDCFGYVCDFVGDDKGDHAFNDALERQYEAHYVSDEAEPSITWEIRCMPLLRVL